MKKKNVILIISIVSVVLLVAAGTFAYWYYRGANKNVSLVTGAGIDDSSIVYNVGESHFVGNFQPVSSFCQSTSTTLSFYKTSAAANANLVATIYMKVNDIGDNISASNDVYWLITSGDSGISCEDGLSSSSIINYGTFNGVNDGDIITLNSVGVTTSEQKFTIWIWLDSTGDSLPTLSGDTIDTNVWTEIAMIPVSTPNKPVLDEGMIPITIDENGEPYTVASSDPSWYNYENKEWANVVLVDNDSRAYYKSNLSNNIKVEEQDILAYYVWIPRYSYKIPEVKCSTIPEEKRNKNDYPECYAPYTLSASDKNHLIDYWAYVSNPGYTDNTAEYEINSALTKGVFVNDFPGSIIELVHMYNNGYYFDGFPQFEDAVTITLNSSQFNENNKLYGDGAETTIDIQFESKNSVKQKGDAINTYYTHPAFTFGSNELSGMWVGKFESTIGDTKYLSLSNNFTVLPNEKSYAFAFENISNQFYISRTLTENNNIYGLSNISSDGHMMKSSEWGAVLYLSHSIYGINKNISVNSCIDEDSDSWELYALSGGGNEEDPDFGLICSNVYGTDGLQEYSQSTTGNITGVFDMSGGAGEYVMGHYMVENKYEIDFSGFNELPNERYFDIYRNHSLEVCTLETCGGHALNETAGWYSSLVGVNNELTSSSSWLIRDGAGNSSYYGSFVIDGSDGADEYLVSWRSVLATEIGS